MKYRVFHSECRYSAPQRLSPQRHCPRIDTLLIFGILRVFCFLWRNGIRCSRHHEFKFMRCCLLVTRIFRKIIQMCHVEPTVTCVSNAFDRSNLSCTEMLLSTTYVLACLQVDQRTVYLDDTVPHRAAES
jgi:hypothetical protein